MGSLCNVRWLYKNAFELGSNNYRGAPLFCLLVLRLKHTPQQHAACTTLPAMPMDRANRYFEEEGGVFRL